MKGKQLRKAVLLGMAMSMAVWTTGMAAEAIVADGVMLEPIITTTGDYSIESEGNGITASNGGSVMIETTNGTNTVSAGGHGISAIDGSSVNLTGEENYISTIGSTSTSSSSYAGIHVGNSTSVSDSDGSRVSVTSTSGDISVSIGDEINRYHDTHGIIARGGYLSLEAGKDIVINTFGKIDNAFSNQSTGLWIQRGGVGVLKADNDVIVKTDSEGAGSYGVRADEYSLEITAGHDVRISTNGVNSIAFQGMNNSVFDVNAGGDISLEATATRTEGLSVPINGVGIYNMEGQVSLDAQENISVRANGKNTNVFGVQALTYNADNSGTTIDGESVQLVAHTEWNSIAGMNGFTAEGIEASATATGKTTVTVNAASDITIVGNADNKTNTTTYSSGITASTGEVNVTSESGVVSISGTGTGKVTGYGIYAVKGSTVNSTAGLKNTIRGNTYGIYSTGNSDVTSEVNLTASNGDNIVQAGTIDEQGFGSGIAVKALSGAQLTFKAENGWNAHLGAIDTRNDGTNVTLDGVVNAVYSAAAINNAGGLDSDPVFEGKKVISALYAEGDAAITATGDWNIFRTTADPTNKNQLERVLWAYDGADITVDGGVYISTDSYSISPNSADIAIAAGTATDLTYGEVTTSVADEDRAHVNLTYGAGSSITGDILAAYAGTVNIDAKEGSNAGISVTGNILAGNNGVLNIDLGKGGYLEGRADDYGDAGLNTTGEDNIDQGHATHEFFNPAFSSTIFKGGEVNLTMGEGSRWNVTGQSWVTRINTESAALADDVLAAENPVEAMNHMATIDLVEANTDRNTNAHALTVYEMTGDAVFNMSLDADRDVSDMLYMKSANGDYIINVVDAVTLDDMYAEGFDGLRFATVGEGSNVSFRAVTVGQGVFNVEYEVGTDAYANNDENHAYNGGESVSEDKPGSDLVDGFFESTQEPGTAETQASRKRMRMAAMAMPAAANDGIMLLDDAAAADDTATAAGGSVDETTNFKLIGRKDESTSNTGKTIIAMSKVNYSNAIYMDRLNKRMGEARYIDGDEGLWVRMRHDRIGKSDAFRSKNTMFELGYDRKVGDREDGEHRQGVVFDYMRGTADYHNVAGEGDVRRGGVWFYDTWLGNKGHYTDYVLKFGRLSNDFDIYSELGEKITGDYSNFVYSASAEYGRKKSLGGDWYIEPQAQLQYAHVTDADYTTSQGTSVQLDAIDSLIGRVGFRLGKDVSDTSTFYIKADVLHEFLGDQDISAFDATGRLDTTYENEGTWYDIGLGFSHQFSKGTYMFLDVEKTFGNDNEDTYQFNVGMNWKV